VLFHYINTAAMDVATSILLRPNIKPMISSKRRGWSRSTKLAWGFHGYLGNEADKNTRCPESISRSSTSASWELPISICCEARTCELATRGQTIRPHPHQRASPLCRAKHRHQHHPIMPATDQWPPTTPPCPTRLPRVLAWSKDLGLSRNRKGNFLLRTGSIWFG
jgi:hypothetical protein